MPGTARRLRRADSGVFPYLARGRTRWAVEYRDPQTGRWKRKSGFIRKIQADGFKLHQERIREGLLQPVPGVVLFHDAIDAYRADRLERGHRKGSYCYLDIWRRRFEGRPINGITSEEIEAALKEWRKEHGWSAGTRNIALAQVSGVFSYAYRQRPAWVASHPTERGRVPRLKTDNARERWLTEAEFAKLLEAAPPWMADLLRWAAITGMRLGEVTTLRVCDVRWEPRPHVLTGATKNRKPLVWPLVGWTLQHARKVAKHGKPEDRLLPGPTGTGARTAIKRGFREVVEAAGLPWGRKRDGVTFHSLRHTMATHARLSGIEPRIVQKMGNWRDPRMVARYSHLLDTELVQAARTMGRKFGGSSATPRRQDRKTPEKRPASLKKRAVDG